MTDWLFRLLFPNQYKQIKHITGLFNKSGSPDCVVSAPDGVCLKNILVYLVTDGQSSTMKCEWIETPCQSETYCRQQCGLS